MRRRQSRRAAPNVDAWSAPVVRRFYSARLRSTASAREMRTDRGEDDLMRKVILQEFLSLDGLAAGREDNVDFVPASTKDDLVFGREQLEMMDSIDTIVLGRVTYQMFAGYWPHVTEGEESLFAERMNATPKIVFSRTLDRAPWGTWDDAIVNRSDASAEVQKLKRQSGKDMVVWGS